MHFLSQLCREVESGADILGRLAVVYPLLPGTVGIHAPEPQYDDIDPAILNNIFSLVEVPPCPSVTMHG